MANIITLKTNFTNLSNITFNKTLLKNLTAKNIISQGVSNAHSFVSNYDLIISAILFVFLNYILYDKQGNFILDELRAIGISSGITTFILIIFYIFGFVYNLQIIGIYFAILLLSTAISIYIRNKQ